MSVTSARPVDPHLRESQSDTDHAPLRRRHVALPDGRWLEVLEYGDLDGFPLLTFHGSPGSGVESSIYMDAALATGFRVISVSRPGFSTSSWARHRSVDRFTEDCAVVLDTLGIDRLAISGYSAGCAYAVACAHAWPERVAVLGLLAPAAPRSLTGALPGVSLPILASNGFTYAVARRIPFLRKLMNSVAHRTGDFRGMPDASAEAFLASLEGAFRQGPKATLWDLWLVLTKWSVEPSRLHNLPVVVWQGKRDAVVRWRGTERLAASIPTSRMRFDAGANHFSIFTRHADELLDELRDFVAHAG